MACRRAAGRACSDRGVRKGKDVTLVGYSIDLVRAMKAANALAATKSMPR